MPITDYFLTSELIEPGLVAKPTDGSLIATIGGGSYGAGGNDGVVGIGVDGYGGSNGNGQHDLRPFYAEQMVEISGLGTYYFAAPNVDELATRQPQAGWGRAVAYGYDKAAAGVEAMFGHVRAREMHSYVCPQSVYKLHPLMDEVGGSSLDISVG
jgi:hypothetical protein